MIRVLFILIPVAVTVYALIDALMAPRAEVRLMSKWIWVVVILLLWIGGALLWFFLGRPRKGKPGIGQASAPSATQAPPAAKVDRPMGPDDDPEFLS